MKAVVVGLGVQGKKRIAMLSSGELFATVDPFKKEAKFKSLYDVPIIEFDTVYLCVQDDLKEKMINYCIINNKNLLIEKPLILKKSNTIDYLQKVINKKKITFYSAYNHRFEPHIVTLKKIIYKNTLGKIYSCRMFYGNGTAKIVKSSPWRDKKSGVLSDLGPHLIDLCYFLFGIKKTGMFNLVNSFSHENKSPDHVIIKSTNKNINIELEMTLGMWKNHFTCDIIGEKGSAHISSLCKWGPSKLIVRKRKYPSGRPTEKIKVLKKTDPTWKKEQIFFKKLIKSNIKTNLQNDKKILENIFRVESQISK